MNTRSSLVYLQKYVGKKLIQRGFDNETIEETMMLFCEESGELAKAIRKSRKIKTDPESIDYKISEELADIFWYLLVLSNKLNVNLNKAFIEKEKKNELRKWV